PLQIVHRDVSPPNLLVSYDGAIKLVDFGIAKAVSCVEQTRPGVVKGKYAYMSPEQTVGKKLDGRSDVFSLSIVLWELLAGQVMIPREDPVEGMRMIRDDRLPALDAVRPDIPPALAAAIARGMANDRDGRATALELGLMLESFIKSAPEGIGSPLEVASWLRPRFPREPATGPENALGAPGTRPATMATRGLEGRRPLTSVEQAKAAAGATYAPTPSSSKAVPLGPDADSIIVEQFTDQDDVTD